VVQILTCFSYAKDYSSAQKYFKKLRDGCAQDGWIQLENSMLDLNLECLWRLQEKKEFVDGAIELLSRLASSSLKRYSNEQKSEVYSSASSGYTNDSSIVQKGYLRRVLQASIDFNTEVKLPLESFFSDIEIDSHLQHHQEKDGFQVLLKLRYLLVESLPVTCVKTRLLDIKEGHEKQIWLENNEAFKIEKGRHSIPLSTNVRFSS
jgi:hypothetical protein